MSEWPGYSASAPRDDPGYTAPGYTGSPNDGSPNDGSPNDGSPYDGPPSSVPPAGAHGVEPYGEPQYPYASPPAYPGYPTSPASAGYPTSPASAGYPTSPASAGYPTQPPAYPGYPPPSYSGYPAPPGPAGYPGYPAPHPAYAGYPPTPDAGRPGTLTAAAVLGYISAGCLIVAAILLFAGSSTFESADYDGSLHDALAELVVAGFVNLLAAGLLIGGAVSMSSRSITGRKLYAVGSGVVLVSSFYWLVRWAFRSDVTLGQILFWALYFAALAVVGLSLAFTRRVGAWFAGR